MLLIATLLTAVAATTLVVWRLRSRSFSRLYAKVEPSLSQSLRSFRQDNRIKRVQVDKTPWEYVSLGTGPETVVFLHGLAGAHDIFWQQINELKKRFRVISVTYPPACRTLKNLEEGLLAVLAAEGVQVFNVVAASLGGYFIQFFMARHPGRVRRAVLTNSFLPNDHFAKKNRALINTLSFFPSGVVLALFRRHIKKKIFPAAAENELTFAFLNEFTSCRMSKHALLGRAHCALEKFAPPSSSVPLLILESDNDPLIVPSLREQLRKTYPEAQNYIFTGGGHFPYINQEGKFTDLLLGFFSLQ